MKKITRKNKINYLEKRLSSFKKNIDKFSISLDSKIQKINDELNDLNDFCVGNVRNIDQWLIDFIKHIKEKELG